jgi:uracil phosphoribosyltransferase
MERGVAKEIHIAVVIAAPEGIAHLENTCLILPSLGPLLDDKLDERSYIVPG